VWFDPKYQNQLNSSTNPPIVAIRNLKAKIKCTKLRENVKKFQGPKVDLHAKASVVLTINERSMPRQQLTKSASELIINKDDEHRRSSKRLNLLKMQTLKIH
jgi:hypothetical protein